MTLGIRFRRAAQARETAREARRRPHLSVESMEDRLVLSTMQPMNGARNCVFDLMVVMDGSGSIDPADFDLQKQFVNELVSSFNVSANFAHFGIVQFSSQNLGRVEIGLSDDPAAITAAVTNIVQIQGLTDIEEGLTLANSEIVSAGRPGVPSVIVLLTDGQHNEGGDPITTADDIKSHGTLIFSVGVGTGIDITELNAIASDPDSEFVFLAQNFQDLQNIVNSLADKVCAVTSQLTLAPATASGNAGTSHTLTATIQTTQQQPVPNVPVNLSILSGPNAGLVISPVVSDSAGKAVFSYASNGLPGTDVIVATATIQNPDGSQTTLRSPEVTMEWVGVVAPPKVTEVWRYGFHHQPTTLTVGFDQPMDAASVENYENYVLVHAGHDRRYGTRDDRFIPVTAAAYDAASRTATIYPSRRLGLHHRYLFTIDAQPPGGVANAQGIYLDGDGSGSPGTNFEMIVDKNIAVLPIRGGRAARQGPVAKSRLVKNAIPKMASASRVSVPARPAMKRAAAGRMN
jgi:hypothetical protein